MPDHSPLDHSIFITGPTSAGKSAIALDCARLCKGEIVCADAFQLYREFPILSAQPSSEDKSEIPHHLFSIIPGTEEMDAARFGKLTLATLTNIVQRGCTPIVVGGSGLYLQALIVGLPDIPAIDVSIRTKVRTMPLSEMLEALSRLDPVSLLQIDTHNPRRVARRLEISLQTSRPASDILTPLPTPSNLRGFFLTRERDDLFARIELAVTARLAQGAIEEVQNARDTIGPTARQILGWREITNLLDGKISLAQCREQLVVATRQYAKRQLTWFRTKLTLPVINLTTVPQENLNSALRHAALS